MRSNTQPALKIGAVASAAGVHVQTIRYYETLNLIERPARTDGGFRLYGRDAIGQLRFIKKAQALGFTLEEIAELLALDRTPGTTCGQMRTRVDAKIRDVRERIAQLGRLLKSLEGLSKECPGGTKPKVHCPILRSLAEEDDR